MTRSRPAALGVLWMLHVAIPLCSSTSTTRSDNTTTLPLTHRQHSEAVLDPQSVTHRHANLEPQHSEAARRTSHEVTDDVSNQKDDSPKTTTSQADDVSNQKDDSPKTTTSQADDVSNQKDYSPKTTTSQADDVSNQKDDSPKTTTSQADDVSNQKDDSPKTTTSQADDVSNQKDDNSSKTTTSQAGISNQKDDYSPKATTSQADDVSNQKDDNSPETTTSQADDVPNQKDDNSPNTTTTQGNPDVSNQTDDSPETTTRQARSTDISFTPYTHVNVRPTSSVHDINGDDPVHTDDNSAESTTHKPRSTHSNFTPYTYVNISADQCVNGGEILRLHSLKGRLFLYNTPNTTAGHPSTRHTACRFTITVPASRFIHVQVEYHGVKFILDDHLSKSELTIYRKDSVSGPAKASLFFSSKISVKLVQNLSSSFYLDAHFNSIPTVSETRLQVLHRPSQHKGFIQTPLYDGHSLSFPIYWITTQQAPHTHTHAVPVGHTLMLSLQGMDVCCSVNSGLTLTLLDDSSRITHTLDPFKHLPSPTLYSPASFSFRFKVRELVTSMYRRGFRVLFSFHNSTALPQRSKDDGLWNCSVEFWPDFLQHFLCDFLPQCREAEDEASCSYTTNKCGRGRVAIGDSCYVYVVIDGRHISWFGAERLCKARGARLALLKSSAEWTSLVRSLWLRHYSPVVQHLLIGLQLTSRGIPVMYRNVWQHNNRTMAFFFRPAVGFRLTTDATLCGRIYSNSFRTVPVSRTCTQRLRHVRVLCEYENNPKPVQRNQNLIHNLHIDKLQARQNVIPKLTSCPQSHLTHDFLSCDTTSACWGRAESIFASCESLNAQTSGVCDVALRPQPPTFSCSEGGGRVSYTLVCDHRSDCNDDSDESFCVFPHCAWETQFDCGNGQCLPKAVECDHYPQCLTGHDEDTCSAALISTPLVNIHPPAVVYLDTDGFLKTRSARTSWYSNAVVCEETYVECPGHNYCIPVFLVCNGVDDCPHREDEAGCGGEGLSCAGLYRCRGSSVCLHTSHLCDGLSHCPQRDDELLCGGMSIRCPPRCTCYGLAFFCTGSFHAGLHSQLRFLEAGSSGLQPGEVSNNTMLVYLGVARCGIASLRLPRLPNLYSLDLKDNLLQVFTVSSLDSVRNLRSLSLAGNPVVSVLTHGSGDFSLDSLHSVDLSHVKIQSLNVTDLSFAPHIKILNVSGSSIQRISPEGFRTLSQLQTLDLRGCRISHFEAGLFEGLSELTLVLSDSYKFCCPAILPEGFNVLHCHAPSDEVSSCQSLLRSSYFRVFLALFSVLAVLGNLASLLVRLVLNTGRRRTGFDTFVTNLSLADCCMGVYLAVLGVADRVYQGDYVWRDHQWKNSPSCALAGFLSLLSSEVSALIICLITLDRFLVLRFPLSRVRFSPGAALAACGGVWTLGVVVAAVPLLPVTSHWRFYSQSGICLPLPVTRRNHFPGHAYSFGIMIVTNFVLFLLIAIGQVVIYASVKSNTLPGYDSANSSKEMTVARRLITIAVSDFLCWFPIGLLGLLAAAGVAVPGEVNVAMAIFALPINSAINPFLYTLNIVLERRRRQQEERIKRFIQSRLKDAF